MDVSVWKDSGTPFAHLVQTLFLQRQQPPSHDIQIGERGGDLQTVQVLGQATVTGVSGILCDAGRLIG